MAKTTIYDIAKEAGVSIATVSRVINKSEGIADKTRKKVLKVADELGYHPQAYAQGLARNKKNIIMVVVPVLSNYFFMEVLAGIQDEMTNYKYDLNIFNVGSNSEESMFHEVENILKRGWADGYLFISTHMQEQQLEKLKRHDMPITLIDESFSGSDSVTVNNEEGVQKAMDYFLESGYERIAMISAMKSSKPSKQRIDGYKKALKKADMPVDEQLIMTGDSMYRDGFSEENGYEAMSKLLELPNPPEACFCSSDIQAVGALKAMKEKGVEIPVIGYDDITISNYIGLSTIRQPMYDMGMYATKRLMNKMKNSKLTPTHKEFTPELVLRSSTDV
ncbi:LacI family transcriptional regulator [Aliifodinibius sp. S!AR15-10]|uniref:LacI family DNA-binding transcriptional regulator n=1 Tax=Aliifodinibius sp. S!AR15-10 TaxID=2950437 RepID=UPI002858904C|nr:LacI family DNA-binding transcriptional regulator [Aliifodinibius sp. S!AR15-10]MDR8390319.1 LacI family transcriptional regulator [Aliifodinibius sp. S!AR15-10]